MTLQEFYTLQEETFDSFCKTLIRNESINAHKEYTFRNQNETPISALTIREQQQLSHEDHPHEFAKQFTVRGQLIGVQDPDLSDALHSLLPQHREVILLSYFLGCSDAEIGQLLKLNTNTVFYRRKAALKKLRIFLEATSHD